MKLTTLIILIAFMQVSAKTYSQITLHVNNKPLTEVLETVKKQTGYVFFYEGHLLDNINITVDINNAPLTRTMDECLKNLSLTYNVVKKNVIITKANSKELNTGKEQSTFQMTFSGRVTDTLGTPLIGASVAIKGTNIGVITNETGEFLIKIQPGQTLVFSYIGYKPFEFYYDGSSNQITVALHPGINGLKEVVVSTGYQKLSKNNETGSVTVLDNKLFNNRVSSNVIDRLDGNVPGLLFNHTSSASGQNAEGNTTGGFDINIRGHSTLFSNDQPLVVVDNFPYDGNLNNINPNDVENITILKDAAAASIWGVRSGNGVIVITTKKGKRNEALKVEFNANVTVSQKPDLFKNPYNLNSNNYINVEQKLFATGFYDGANPWDVASPVVQLLRDQQSGLISSEDATSQINALRNQDVRKDLNKYYFQNSVTQQYNLNLHGGTDKSDYYFSVGEDNGKANLVGNANNRISISSGYDFYPLKNLQLSARIAYTKVNNQNNSTLGSLNTIYPYSRLADANGNPLSTPSDFSPAYKAGLVSQGFLNWDLKPLDELTLADNNTSAYDNTINVSAKYNFLKNFSFSANYNYERNVGENSNNYDVNSYYARNLINRYTQINSDGTLSYPIPIGGIINQTNSNLTSQRGRIQLDYNSRFNEHNQLIMLAGAEISQQITSSYNSMFYGYNKETGSTNSSLDYVDYFGTSGTYNNQQITTPNALNTGNTTNFLSYFASGIYSYDDRYIASLSARIDHTNLFGVSTNQKAVPLYAIGLGWLLNKEKFYNINWLPLLKPRFSFGYTGNINLGAAAVTTIYTTNGNAIYNNTSYGVINTPGNPELRWEKTKTINLGLDFAIKKNIVAGTIEYYWKDGIDLFGSSPLSPSTGLSSFFGNTANTRGHGLEITINSININSESFKWNTTFILSHVIDKVTKYDAPTTPALYFSNQTDNLTINPVVGSDVFAMYAYKSAGLTHDTGDPQGFVNGKASTDYTSILNAPFTELQNYGSARPTTFGSLRNTFIYKNLSLSFNIQYELGYYFRRFSADGIATSYLSQTGFSEYNQAWSKPGDELSTSVPSIQYQNFDANRAMFIRYSTSLVDKGDNIRLQDISLSYDFNNRSILRIFSNLRVYGYINNLGILWRANKYHLDPDALPTPVYSYYPPVKTFAIGIKANF